MNILHTIILGVVEGITEFLPISSTGHLILSAKILGIQNSEFLKTFEIFIQLGAICSVIFLYWRRIMKNIGLAKKIAVAFLPTAVLGLAAYPFIKRYLLNNAPVVLWSLFLGGIAIYLLEKYFEGKKGGTVKLEEMTYQQAVLVGLAQSVALIPGVSRAATTILGGMFIGLDRKSIVEFSFMLAIPTMAAASGLDLVQSASSFNTTEFLMLAVGFFVSFVVALAAVKWLLRYIETHNFISFGIYRIVVAVLFWMLVI
ncbi:MAG: undecaprenyl-diphosphate phosphatase [Candidatus Doudnabacteria bacterium]|nr:undecaprenyl-diphosphate phosphatase [Candidatus Doudnabacteria bacterium]